MWPFGRKKSDLQKEPEKKFDIVQMDEAYFKIAEIITKNDTEVMREIKESFANPQDYQEKHDERLSNCYMLNEKERKAFVLNRWMLMIDILERYNYVCSRDWKDELDDFLYFLFHTKRAVSEQLEGDRFKLVLSQEGDIPQWSTIINGKLAEKNLVVGYIGTDSDSYIVFLCSKQELACLEECASAVNQVICRLKD